MSFSFVLMWTVLNFSEVHWTVSPFRRLWNSSELHRLWSVTFFFVIAMFRMSDKRGKTKFQEILGPCLSDLTDKIWQTRPYSVYYYKTRNKEPPSGVCLAGEPFHLDLHCRFGFNTSSFLASPVSESFEHTVLILISDLSMFWFCFGLSVLQSQIWF